MWGLPSGGCDSFRFREEGCVGTSVAGQIDTAAPGDIGVRASLRTCLTFGLGTTGTAILLNTVVVYFPAMMSTVLGQSAASAGLLLMISNLYDVVADVVIGVASDRTRSRWGRRRPYLLAGTFVSTLSFIAIFAPPQLHGGWLFAYMSAVLVLYSTGYSLFNVPYTAMPAEAIAGYHERTRVLSWRAFFASIGQLIALTGAAALINYGGGAAPSFALMGLLGGLLIGATMGVTFLGSFGLPHIVPDAPPPARERQSIGTSLGSMLRNRPFVLLMSSKTLQFIALSGLSSTSLLFKLEVLKVGYHGQIIFTFSQNVTSALFIVVWVRLSRVIGKRWTYILALLGYAAGNGTWFFAAPGDPIWMLWARGCFLGATAAGAILMSFAMLPDVIEWDRRSTGLRREGMYASAYAVLEKAGFAAGPALFGAYLTASGYVPSLHGHLAAQPPSAITALYAGASIIPVVLLLGAVVLLLFYNLDERRLAAGPAPAGQHD
jgi:GPH family glycoside/pentoside/hexuronide:cation symporter